jgi:hypothetical protein
MTEGAGITFYAILAIVPALAARGLGLWSGRRPHDLRLRSGCRIRWGCPRPRTETAAGEASDQSIADTSKAGGDIFSSIERLAGLRDKGFISAEEFLAKKTNF